jgi:hypothetical protein
MPRGVVSVLIGSALAALTALFAWLVVRAFGRPFGDWEWTTLAFALLLVLLAGLAALAATSAPFEQRLRRWEQPADPLAIRFQMDLAAAEQNPPRGVAIETRWLWMAAPVAVAALVLGAVVASGAQDLARVISDNEAVVAAEAAVRPLVSGDATLRRYGVDLTTIERARADLGADIALPAERPDAIVFVVYFTTGDVPKDGSAAAIEPGPVAVIDAITGEPIAIGVVRWHGRTR